MNTLKPCLTKSQVIMANEFKPSVGKKIEKSEADKWIQKYDNEYRKDNKAQTKSVFYGRDVLLDILSKDGCAGISFFFCVQPNKAEGKDALGLVMAGTTEDGQLMDNSDTTTLAKASATSTYTTYDSGTHCPPYCSK
jgi:hypothetical protein